MAQEIEVDSEGKLTQAQSDKFTLTSAQVVKDIFETISKVSAEEMIDIQNRLTQSEFMLTVANQAFKTVVDANLPQAYNQALIYKAMSVIQTVFEQIADKIASNEKLVLEKKIGIKYNDITPKNVIDYLTSDSVN